MQGGDGLDEAVFAAAVLWQFGPGWDEGGLHFEEVHVQEQSVIELAEGEAGAGVGGGRCGGQYECRAVRDAGDVSRCRDAGAEDAHERAEARCAGDGDGGVGVGDACPCEAAGAADAVEVGRGDDVHVTETGLVAGDADLVGAGGAVAVEAADGGDTAGGGGLGEVVIKPGGHVERAEAGQFHRAFLGQAAGLEQAADVGFGDAGDCGDVEVLSGDWAVGRGDGVAGVRLGGGVDGHGGAACEELQGGAAHLAVLLGEEREFHVFLHAGHGFHAAIQEQVRDAGWVHDALGDDGFPVGLAEVLDGAAQAFAVGVLVGDVGAVHGFVVFHATETAGKADVCGGREFDVFGCAAFLHHGGEGHFVWVEKDQLVREILVVDW